MADEDIAVTIEAEPDEKETLVKVEEKHDDAVADLKAQYDELQKKNEAESKAREDADRRAAQARREAEQARREADSARSSVVDSEVQTVASGIAAAEAEAKAAKQAHAAAMEAGNFVDAGEALERLADARATLVTLNSAKADLEVRKAQPPAQPSTEQPADPVEAYIAGRTEPTQRWLRANRDWVTDPRKNARLTSAHWAAVAEGLSPDTDEYFADVETRIGLRKSATEGNGADVVQVKAHTRRATPPVAPVNAAAGGGSGKGEVVRLTHGEAQSATDGTHRWGLHDLAAGRIKDKSLVDKPIGIEEMARRKLAMTKEGLYDKTYTEQ